MTKQERINKAAIAISQFHKERDYFLSMLAYANTPEELETLIVDEKWANRRKEVARRFNKMLEGVI